MFVFRYGALDLGQEIFQRNVENANSGLHILLKTGVVDRSTADLFGFHSKVGCLFDERSEERSSNDEVIVVLQSELEVTLVIFGISISHWNNGGAELILGVHGIVLDWGLVIFRFSSGNTSCQNIGSIFFGESDGSRVKDLSLRIGNVNNLHVVHSRDQIQKSFVFLHGGQKSSRTVRIHGKRVFGGHLDFTRRVEHSGHFLLNKENIALSGTEVVVFLEEVFGSFVVEMIRHNYKLAFLSLSGNGCSLMCSHLSLEEVRNMKREIGLVRLIGIGTTVRLVHTELGTPITGDQNQCDETFFDLLISGSFNSSEVLNFIRLNDALGVKLTVFLWGLRSIGFSLARCELIEQLLSLLGVDKVTVIEENLLFFLIERLELALIFFFNGQGLEYLVLLTLLVFIHNSTLSLHNSIIVNSGFVELLLIRPRWGTAFITHDFRFLTPF